MRRARAFGSGWEAGTPLVLGGAGAGGGQPEREAPSPGDLATRFSVELARHRREPLRPLPARFAPLASAIVGRRAVHVSTGEASRSALRAVNKRAATTGSVMHFERMPTAGPADHALVAHELTHVAHPSPEPRFFSDDRGGPEERRADAVARIMRAAPVLPRATAATDSPSPRPSPSPSPSPIARTAAPAPTVHAGDLATRLTSPSSAPGVVRRLVRDGSAPSSPQHTSSTDEARSLESPEATGASSTTRSSRSLIDDMDRIVELLEERILAELERRGGRYGGEL